MNFSLRAARLWPVALGLCATVASLAQPATALEERIKERGPHHQIVESVRQEPDEAGNLVPVTNRYTQLESGLNFRNAQGEWEATKAEFELVPEGAIAWKGQHRVSLANDLNTAGAIQLRLPDGQMVVGHVLGLGYFDTSTGEATLIATVKDSTGWLVTPNQITYPDAFEGVAADVRYTYSRSGFEQDIILREQPPTPEKFGFNPATTRLEVWTEFTQAPEPDEPARQASLHGKAAGDADEVLDFGSMRIGEGRSFLLGQETGKSDPVRKNWLKSANGRKFLVEAVDLPAVAAELEALPATKEEAALPAVKGRSRMQAMNGMPVKVKRASTQTAMRRMEGRKDMVAAYQKPGLVVDYQFTISTDKTDFTFQSDHTYYVTGYCNLSGTTTLEGGAVIKFAQYVSGSVDPRLYVLGSFVSKTSRYKPAVFTAKDDNTVGETISGSSGNPGTTAYANISLRFYSAPVAKLEHVRFRNAIHGPSFHSSSSNTLAHAQIVNCQYPFSNTGTGAAGCYNVLIDNVLPSGVAVYGWTNTSTIYFEHLTLRRSPALLSSVAVVLKNSLLVQVTNVQSYTGSGNQQLSSEAGVFQPAWAGNHYLPASSPHRNVGVTTIDPTLAAELKQLTTEAPLVLATDLNVELTLSPRARRDSDTPDRGYHYPPLDYVFNNPKLYNKLTLAGGVAVAMAGSYGIDLQAGSELISEGRAEQMNVLTRWNAVQEQPGSGGAGGAICRIGSAYSPRPIINLRFSEITALCEANGTALVDIGSTQPFNSVTVEFCQLRNVGLKNLWPVDTSSVSVTLRNNLFERCEHGFKKSYYSEDTPFTVTLRNNLFWKGNLVLLYDDGDNDPGWTVKDNLFDGVTNALTGTLTNAVTASHNGFTSGTVTNAYWRSANDKTGLNTDYQSNGTWGYRYYPATGSAPSLATLIDVGSQTRTAAGLYHFTVKTAANSKEGADASTTVDIGHHYVGLNTSGVPNDADGDGLPDYVEDRDGDNTLDSGETDPASSINGITGGSALVVFTPLQ